MSGRENPSYRLRGLGLEGLDDFALDSRSMGIDVNLLRRAQGVTDSKGNATRATSPLPGVSSWAGAFSYDDPNTKGQSSADSARVETALTAYNAWKMDRDSAIAQHKEYLKITSERPGRKATVLVPTGEPSRDQLLTGRDISTRLL